MKVLLVDDCPLITRIYGDFLRKEGHEISTSGTPFGVLNSIRDNPPDLILMDMNLPGLSGRKLLELIRTQKKIPAIVISSSGEDALKELVASGDAEGYYVKGDHLEKLGLEINKLLIQKG